MTTLQWLLLTGAVTLVLGFYLYGRRLQDEDPWHGVEHEDGDDGHLDFDPAPAEKSSYQNSDISPYSEQLPAAPAQEPAEEAAEVPGAREWAESRGREAAVTASPPSSYDGPMPKQQLGYPYASPTEESVVPAQQPATDPDYESIPVRLRAEARPKRKARWSFLTRREPEPGAADDSFDDFDDDPIESSSAPLVDPAVEDEYQDSRQEAAADPAWLEASVRKPPADLVEEVGAPKAPEPEPAADPQLGLNIENERPAAKQERIKNVPDGEEKIVILHVRAKDGQKFEGPAIHSALQLTRLKFGMRSIYHRVTEVNGMPEVVFSCASMVKPGYLDPVESNGFSTPGLTFFMVLPGPLDGVASFRDLLSTADKLALRLGGEVLDETRTRITHQSAQYMRDEIAELERQWRVPAKGK